MSWCIPPQAIRPQAFLVPSIHIRSNFARPSYSSTHASCSAVNWNLLLALTPALRCRTSLATGSCPARRASTAIECAALHLALLIRWYALHSLNLLLHILNGFTGLHLKLDCLAGKPLHKTLHTAAQNQDEVQRRLRLDVIVYKSSPILNPASTPYNLQGSNCALSVHVDSNCKANPMA